VSAGGGATDADPADVLAAATAVRRAADRMQGAWQPLSAALVATTAMAGDDPAGRGFAGDYDPLVSAA
jgi:hypothetical protein